MHNTSPICAAFWLLAPLSQDSLRQWEEVEKELRDRYGITHFMVLAESHYLIPTRWKWIPTAGKWDTTLRHAQGSDWVVVFEHPLLEDFARDCLAKQKQGIESEQCRRVKRGPVVAKPSAVWIPKAGEAPRWLGITIATPAYADLAAEAVKRFIKFTGQPALCLHAPSEEAAFLLKLSLSDWVSGADLPNLIYFDADCWILRPLPLKQWEEDHDWLFMAVPDAGVADTRSFVAVDCATHGIDPARYFNSGFYVLRQGQRLPIGDAEWAFENRQWADYGEQSAFNWAMQQERGLPLTPLPQHFNFFMHGVTHGYVPAIPAPVYCLHAAGVPVAKKMEHLKEWAKVLSFEVKPLPVTADHG